MLLTISRDCEKLRVHKLRVYKLRVQKSKVEKIKVVTVDTVQNTLQQEKKPIERIAKDKQVTIHFTLCLVDGEVIDTTEGKQPAVFVLGDGNLLPGFEKPLMGLKSGDKRSVVISPEQGFGPHRDDNVQKFKRDQFADIAATGTIEPGVVINFADASNAELPGVVQEVQTDYVVVDFNHPLAGKDLTFQVEILDVSEPAQPVKMVE